jgi:hypothetical protein
MIGHQQCRETLSFHLSNLLTFDSTLEGGSNAQTYCAPQAAACAGKDGYSVQSEQDFQSFAHSALLVSEEVLPSVSLHY